MRITSFRHFLALLGLVSFTPQLAFANLYAATSAGSPGELYIISTLDGSMVQDIGPLNDPSGTNYPITGMAFHPTTGVLFGSTGNAGDVDALLVTINPATAQVSVVGPFNAGPVNSSGTPTTMADISFDSAGNLFGVASIGGPNLYSINPTNGQATLVGANGVSAATTGGGLAISSSDIFYGTPTASRYGTYNPATGVYTNITNPAKPLGGSYGALEFDGATLYGLNVGTGSPPPTALVTIDPTTGTVTNLGTSIQALDSIAAPVSIPEPTTMALIGSTALMLTIRRRANR